MEFGGEYHGMGYTVRYIEDEHLGSFYDVLLTIGDKQSHERASTIIDAINKLIALIRAWDFEDEDIIMTPEQAQQRIAEWKAAWALIHSLPDAERDSERAKDALATILLASMDLSAAGYRTNEDETDWYHPSKEN
jgi:hypothetical protein